MSSTPNIEFESSNNRDKFEQTLEYYNSGFKQELESIRTYRLMKKEAKDMKVDIETALNATTEAVQRVKSFTQDHSYHMVGPSPWPLFNSLSLLSLTSSFAFLMHSYGNIKYIAALAAVSLICSMSLWLKDIISEGTYTGNHTLAVQKGISMAFTLFIISEIFFFLSIFWAYFHSALSPAVELGVAWPPLGIKPINPFELPLLNTIILLSSAVSVTYAHHCLIKNEREGSLNGLVFTIILAVFFTYFQNLEYSVSGFTISDGVFGSCFFFGTGFHGLHVLIGTVFLFVGLGRVFAYHFSGNHHLGLESAILYWHFVDIVWIFLYLAIYYWGS